MPTLEELLVTIDATTENLRRELKRADDSVVDFAGKVGKSVDRVQKELDRVAAKTKTLATQMNANLRVATDFGAERRAADIAAYGAELDRLRAKFNPLFAAQQAYKGQLAEIGNALRLGAISQAEYGAAVARTKDAFAEQVRAINGVAAPMAQGQAGFRRFGAAAQQAGYQVGDFAVQVASGTSPVLAFTQQASQLLGFFGPFGAVAGAAAAVLGGLWLAFSRTAEETENAKGAAKGYEKALSALADVNRQMEGASRTLQASLQAEARWHVEAAQAALTAAREKLAAREQEAQARMLEMQMFGAPGDNAALQAQVDRMAGVTDTLIGKFKEARQAYWEIWGAANATANEGGETRRLREMLDPGDAPEKLTRTATAAERLVAELRAEADAIGQTTLQRKIAEALRKAETDATTALGAEIVRLTTRLHDEAAAQEARAAAIERATEAAEKELRDREAASERARALLKDRDDLIRSRERELSQTEALIEALGVSQREYRVVAEAQRLMAQSTLLTADAARELAERTIDAADRMERMRAVTDEIQDAIAAPIDNPLNSINPHVEGSPDDCLCLRDF